MHIPVNKMKDLSCDGTAITRAIIGEKWIYNELQQVHRDEYHLFLVQEEGTSEIRVDFQSYHLKAGAIMCIHPSQVHQLGPFAPGKVSFLIMDNESLTPVHLHMLEELTPLKPIRPDDQLFRLITDTVSVCVEIYGNEDWAMHRQLVQQGCNTLVGLLIAACIKETTSHGELSRSNAITKSFKTLLEHHYVTLKRSSDYAEKLHISTTYLYECVKKTTGLSVSQHIEQRVVLEAKRLLYYSDHSIKEIAAELGFSDYPYFTRLFAKVTGMTAMTFRKKNQSR